MKKCYIIIITILLVLFNFSFVFSEELDRLKKFKREKIYVNGRNLNVLIAKTDKEREEGLSRVDLNLLQRMGLDGMLFVFEKPGEKTFQAWHMKFDLMLLVLEKKRRNEFYVKDRKPLRIGTVEKVTGEYILEIPLKNTISGGR